MKKIIARDIFGNDNQFFYDISDSSYYNGTTDVPSKEIMIYADEEKSGDFFLLQLIDFGEYLQVVDITHNEDERYRKKGIPEAIICELINVFDKSIHSSSLLNKKFPTESRSDPAKKYWERLRKEGKADYNSDSDHYFTL